MKKIRFIKENDLFQWEIGDIKEISLSEMRNDAIWIKTSYRSAYLNISELVENGYVEWIIDDEVMEEFGEACQRVVKAFREGIINLAEQYKSEEEIEDFHEAWCYIEDKLYENKKAVDKKQEGRAVNDLFSHGIQDILHIEVAKIDPESEEISDDETKNTETRIWLEFGFPEYDENLEQLMHVHDIDYDIEGKTFEEAIIKLANRIKNNGDDSVVNQFPGFAKGGKVGRCNKDMVALAPGEAFCSKCDTTVIYKRSSPPINFCYCRKRDYLMKMTK